LRFGYTLFEEKYNNGTDKDKRCRSDTEISDLTAIVPLHIALAKHCYTHQRHKDIASAIPEKCKTHIRISNRAKGVSHFKAVVRYFDSVSFFIMVYLRFIIVFSDFLSAVGAELGLAKQSIINLATMRTTAAN